jgi:hypothetical protein
MDRAACRGMADESYVLHDPFYPTATKGLNWSRAAEICEACPLDVRTHCLADALDTDRMYPYGGPQGFRAGMTPDQRSLLLKGSS